MKDEQTNSDAMLSKKLSQLETRINNIQNAIRKINRTIGVQSQLASAMSEQRDGSFTSALLNGRQLSSTELQQINKDTLDVILDLRNSTLMFRRDPEKHSELTEINLSEIPGIGSLRIRLLIHLLSNPGVNFLNHKNYAEFYEDLYGDGRDNSALYHSMAQLRKLMGGNGNPYLINVVNALGSQKERARKYIASPQYNYLLIKIQE